MIQQFHTRRKLAKLDGNVELKIHILNLYKFVCHGNGKFSLISILLEYFATALTDANGNESNSANCFNLAAPIEYDEMLQRYTKISEELLRSR